MFRNWHCHIIVLFLKAMVKLLQLPQLQQQQVRIVFFSYEVNNVPLITDDTTSLYRLCSNSDENITEHI